MSWCVLWGDWFIYIFKLSCTLPSSPSFPPFLCPSSYNHFIFLSFSLSFSFILETKQIEPWERKENYLFFFFLIPNLWKVFLNVIHLQSPIQKGGGVKTGSKYDIRELRLSLQYPVRLSISEGF